MEERRMQQDLDCWNGMLFTNAVDLDETMLDLDSELVDLDERKLNLDSELVDLDERMMNLDSSTCEWPVWIDTFVEDCGSLVSELLNYDQRLSDFSSNAMASYVPEIFAIEDNGSLDSCSMELELSSIQEGLMAEIKSEHVAIKALGISDYDNRTMSIEAEQDSSVESDSENCVGGAEAESHDLAPTVGTQSNQIPNASVETESHDLMPTTRSSRQASQAPDWTVLSDCSDYKGVLTIHLLTACCEAISVGSHDLVDILLCRLQEMVSPTGSTIERVAFYLSQALHQLHCGDHMEVKMPKSRDMGALILFNQVYPFIRIPHFTANQSILEAINGPRRKLHIIDFDIMEGMQWPPLMEALKSEGHRIEHLKITALKWDCGDENDDESGAESEDDDSVSLCTHTGRRLSEYAESLGIPFSFEETTMENMKTNKDDEIVAVNCMWELPHMCERSRKSLTAFINGGRQLNPDILTIGTGPPDEPHGNLNLLQSFGECLRNICAVFDCSEAGLAEQFELARTKIENLFLAPMICRPFNNFFSENGELGPLVMDIPLECGFSGGEISKKNGIFAEHMLPINYRMEFEGSHKILLQWHSTVLSRVSVWRPIN